MRIERIAPDGLRVVLSERNLRVLLSKLHMPDSLRTIVTHTDEGRVFVSSEPDDLHYANREPPGRMHPATEADLRKHHDHP